MAGTVIPVGYGQWSFYMQHATIAHTSVSVVGFKVLTPPYTSTQAGSALSAWATALQPLHDNEVTYIRCVTLVGNDGPALRYDVAGATVGTRTAVSIAPPNVTYLLKKATGFAGRAYRGRIYLPFVNSTGVVQTGQLTSTELTILTARSAAIQTGLVAAAPNASELSILHAPPLVGATPSPTPILSLSAEAFVATQRRRLERS